MEWFQFIVCVNIFVLPNITWKLKHISNDEFTWMRLSFLQINQSFCFFFLHIQNLFKLFTKISSSVLLRFWIFFFLFDCKNNCVAYFWNLKCEIHYFIQPLNAIDYPWLIAIDCPWLVAGRPLVLLKPLLKAILTAVPSGKL